MIHGQHIIDTKILKIPYFLLFPEFSCIFQNYLFLRGQTQFSPQGNFTQLAEGCPFSIEEKVL